MRRAATTRQFPLSTRVRVGCAPIGSLPFAPCVQRRMSRTSSACRCVPVFSKMRARCVRPVDREIAKRSAAAWIPSPSRISTAKDASALVNPNWRWILRRPAAWSCDRGSVTNTSATLGRSIMNAGRPWQRNGIDQERERRAVRPARHGEQNRRRPPRSRGSAHCARRACSRAVVGGAPTVQNSAAQRLDRRPFG